MNTTKVYVLLDASGNSPYGTKRRIKAYSTVRMAAAQQICYGPTKIYEFALVGEVDATKL